MILWTFKYALVSCLLVGTAVGADYNYNTQGDDWGGTCQAGRRQSPVDFKSSDLKEVVGEPSIVFHNYDRKTPVIVEVDAAHYTIKVVPREGHDLGISGGGLPANYKLDSLHFHWPSEHTIDGNRFILEAHLVHIKSIYNSTTEAAADPEGIAVLGVLYAEGKENHQLMNIEIGAKEGRGFLNFDQLMPYDKSEFYRYRGSLTTPDCNEAVVWTVFSNIVPATYEQVAAFRALLPDGYQDVDTYREVQPLNGRVVELWSTSQKGLSKVNNITPNPSLLIALIPGLSNSINVPKIFKNY